MGCCCPKMKKRNLSVEAIREQLLKDYFVDDCDDIWFKNQYLPYVPYEAPVPPPRAPSQQYYIDVDMEKSSWNSQFL